MNNLPTDSLTDHDPIVDLCPTCEHPLTAHDPISLRWCAATRLGVGRRTCICPAAAAASRDGMYHLSR